MDKKKILTWVLFFLIFLAVAQLFNKKPEPPSPELTSTAIGIVPTKTEFVSEEEVVVKVRNNTTKAVTLPSNCPKNPFTVLAATGTTFAPRETTSPIDCKLAPDITLNPAEEKLVSYTYWNYALFGDSGRYKIQINTTIDSKPQSFTSSEFTVVEAGFLRKMFRIVFFQPIYNVLVFFISILPGKDLGLAIILLTLVIRLILLVPSQRAIVSQRRMQEIQPKLEEIKKKYAGNQERIGVETMALWKQYKINPFGSCLPLLIQFPVLIGLFYVIRNGLNPDNLHYLYSFLSHVDLTHVNTNFFGILELTKVNLFVLPLIVGLLQFGQFKLGMLKKRAPGADKDGAPKSEMETANKMMMYVMPVMIAIFTASVPAGVGLYWAVSTGFAVVQQAIANKKLRPL